MQILLGGVTHPHIPASPTCSGRQLGASWRGPHHEPFRKGTMAPAGLFPSPVRTGVLAAGAWADQPGARQLCGRGQVRSLGRSSLRRVEAGLVGQADRGARGGTGFLPGRPRPELGSREFSARFQALPCGRRPGQRPVTVLASSSDAAAAPSTTPPTKNVFTMILTAVRSLWKQMTLPLGNFGFGKRSIWEGGVGLFLMAGVFMLALLFSWVKGVQVRAKTSRYQTVFEFSQACGITVGTPVRIRGVDVGSVVGVRPSLERIDVVAEIMDTGVVIPRNSLVEVNQSGLISETLIDITPRKPIPQPTVGPVSPQCEEEGLIVCDRQRIVGQQGVSLDELVGICTKLAKQMDEEGMHNIFRSVHKVTATVEDARPLLEKVTQITTDLQPVLKELSQGDLLKNLESLTKVATEAATDLRELNSSVLTTENTSLLRDSVATLTKTLKHIESISEDVSVLTGDPGTRYNLKQLIESLSRLVND